MVALTGRVLVVDDEQAIRSIVQRYFSKYGAVMHCAGDGEAMHQVLQQHAVDLILLDVHLPDKDGFVLLSEIRRKYGQKLGVIMLTARADLNDRIAGLEAGADDYLAKPFEMGELLARAHAVLRRLDVEQHSQVPDTRRYGFAGYCLDSGLRQLHNEAQQWVELSPAEFDLLHLFVQNPQTVLSRDYLLQKTRGRDAAPYDRTIDVRVGQLRKKLPLRSGERLFKTIRGGGYMLMADVTELS